MRSTLCHARRLPAFVLAALAALPATGAAARSGAPAMIADRMKLPDGREIRS
jgi:hypothetical protein